MRSRITKAQAKLFKKRWAIANAAEIEELRQTPASKKLRQFSLLLLCAPHFRKPRKPAGEELELRNRWNRIRRAFHD